jgi:hypothetical protein
MTPYPTDTAPVALTPPPRPEQVKTAVLQALFDATVRGDVGTVQERLYHKSQKAANDAIMARAKKLCGMDPWRWSQWYQRLTDREDPDRILRDMGE